jgi:calreticulin
MMRSLLLLALLGLAFIVAVQATTYFKEEFDDSWQSRWVVSDWKKSDGTRGDWKLTASEWYGDKKADRGIQTSQDARFYAISAKIAKPFSNAGKDLILQYSVKFPQKIDCGGGYIKLMPSSTDQENFSGDSKYYIMFGPDICGTSTKKTHVIFNYEDKNLLIKKNVPCETDQLTHVYTLIVHPDNTYQVNIDGEKKESGSLYDDWDFLPPKTIKDPSVSKPSEWIDDPMMDDPTDTKPANYDNTPKQIPDPDAEKPQDWDDEADGDWEAPMIDNPEFKGEWKAKRIANPEYKGKWVHPEIANPEFKENNMLYKFDDIGAVGIELWQVKSGTLFDNIIVTDSLAEADALREQTYEVTKAGEKTMFEESEKVKREAEEAERKRAEEERKKSEESKKADSDDEDDDDDEDSHDEL